ncbi:hypothetical protein [Vibrio phage MZH0603]|nr:hypothetical protein [Vibrio phage MZH0603]
MKVTDLTERKLAKTNERLVPLYQEIAALEMELHAKKIALNILEIELLGQAEATQRQLMRGDDNA